MKKLWNRHLRRLSWYIAGLLLFFAPFAFYEKGMKLILGPATRTDFHGICLRMPIYNIIVGPFTGKWVSLLALGTISTILLLVTAFLAGPFFCGRFCATGAIPEYLSRILPDKWKINWTMGVNPAPIRYGFFAGFLLSPFISASLACSFCNYSFMEKITAGGLWTGMGVLGSTTILTAFLWLVLFGLFAKGGRAFCTLMCPVGAAQSLLYSLGARFNFTWKLRFEEDKCVSCSKCTKSCPMGALSQVPEGKIDYQIHNCITCTECTSVCPTKAITYGRGAAGWQPKPVEEGTPVPLQEGV